VAGSTRAIFILQRFLLLPREAVQINMGAELQQEEELSRLASADLVLRIFLRYLKRYQARLSTKFKYDFLGRDVVENVLPDPHAFRSKRSWEAAMHYATTFWFCLLDDTQPKSPSPGAANESKSKRTKKTLHIAPCIAPFFHSSVFL